MRLEGLRWVDALFWMIHPHSIEYRSVHKATKRFHFSSTWGYSRFRCGLQNACW